MLLINVLVEAVRGVSIMYAITVGNVEASESSSILPEALHTKTSIWPGVSTKMCFIDLESGFAGSEAVRFSKIEIRESILVLNKFNEVNIAPVKDVRIAWLKNG
jgi:hypothetical protein